MPCIFSFFSLVSLPPPPRSRPEHTLRAKFHLLNALVSLQTANHFETYRQDAQSICTCLRRTEPGDIVQTAGGADRHPPAAVLAA